MRTVMNNTDKYVDKEYDSNKILYHPGGER